jgi:general secretion pathway protein D
MKRFFPILVVAAILGAQNPAAQNPVPPAGPAAPPISSVPGNNPPAQPAPTTVPQQPVPSNMVLDLPNASLTEVIDTLARRLKINYIIDKRVNGSVTMHTYGEIKGVDVRSLLETILRINGAAMVQVGDIYRIVPTSDVIRLPIRPTDDKNLPDDDRMVMNLVFLKYVTVSEVQKLLDQFMGEGAKSIAYEPANLLIILDNARSLRRTMEMLELFDSQSFANQRVKLFETANGRPTDIVKELEAIFKGISLGEKSNSIKFMPLDRINTIIAVAPNPGIFADVEKWLGKLDIPVRAPVGAVDNWVYRVKYGEAGILSQAVMALYSGDPYMLMMLSQMGMFSSGGSACSGGNTQFGVGGVNLGAGGAGAGGYGMPMGAGGMGAYAGMMNPMMMGGAGMMGMGMMGMGMGGGYGGSGYGGGYGSPYGAYGGGPTMGRNPMSTPGAAPGTTSTDQTGGFLTQNGHGDQGPRSPRVVPNPFDNTLLIQGTPQEYEQIVRLLRQLDVAPRQVLIEARIYEVSLTGAFSSGVQAFLQRKTAASGNPSDASSASRQFLATMTGTGVNLTAGLLVGQSRELLGFMQLQETQGRTKTIASPSIIATDNCQASITVGTDVPTLTSQAVAGIQQSGTSLFTNQIQNRSTGVNFSIKPKVLPSGIVTLEINQDVSSPIPPSPGGGIQSPSFSRRNVSTRVTVQDGDTIAIAGIIQEQDASSSAGIPGAHKIPVLGLFMGNKSSNKARTELVIFMTPRVIYDTNDIADASEEVRSRLKRLQKIVKE